MKFLPFIFLLFTAIYGEYHTHEQLIDSVHNAVRRVGGSAVELGKTSFNRPVVAYEYTQGNRPVLGIMGPVHGDEVTGREGLIHFLDGLQEHSTILDLVDIIVVPSWNPDGFERNMRSTASGVFLNRDFPSSCYDFVPHRTALELNNMIHFMVMSRVNVFVWYHGGSEVVSWGIDSECTHHVEKELDFGFARTYRDMVPYIKNGVNFTNGIVKGSDWYEVRGSASDFAREFGPQTISTFTVETSCVKAPPVGIWGTVADGYAGKETCETHTIAELWPYHEDGLLELAKEMVSAYVHGQVVIPHPTSARVWVVKRDEIPDEDKHRPIKPDADGRFVRPTDVGEIDVIVMAPHMFTKKISVDVHGAVDLGIITLLGQ